MAERRPTLRRTDPATLVVAGLAAAATGWLLVSNLYQSMPPLDWPPVFVIGGLAVFEAVLARYTWVRVQRRDPVAMVGRRPADPLQVARFVVLAKASSLAAALFGGFFAGLLPWLWVEADRLSAAAADLPPAIGGLVASVALLVAALWLERACWVPPPPEEPDPDADRDEPR